ncbi:outer membrane protein assembly factor BamB family protein [Anatilimnocola floriformis]|uniref:outer membrane protein assembly factor BamB family protein n=1 Tax=Anatilimnocola floriformis TaxID=2948575 RepID=UPI0020C55E46|nr:PQQ-binding-like beta-propeller repeat protein [Anatilimnocola floriformis]
MNSALLIVAALVVAGPAEVWPGFNGVGCDTAKIRSLPLHWSEASGIAWRSSQAGAGTSSPVIWKEAIYASGVDVSGRWQVTALRLGDGQRLWAKYGADHSTKNQLGKWAAVSSPVVDTSGVYALGGHHEILALKHGGEVRWRRGLTRSEGTSGATASLAQDEAHVFALFKHQAGSSLVALNKLSGETTWSAARDSSASGTSPILACIDGTPQVIVSSAGMVESYDSETGRRLWWIGNLAGNTAPVPFVSGNMVLIGAMPPSSPHELFQSLQSNLALQVELRDRNWRLQVAWGSNGRLSGLASPVAHASYAYWTDRHAQLSCLAMRDGEEAFSVELDEPCEIAPLAAAGRIYLFGKHGTTTVIEPGPKFAVLAKNKLDFLPEGAEQQTMQQAVAAVENHLVIRTGREIICIRQP